MAITSLIDKTKLAMKISTNAYDNDISDLIDAAKLDLGIAGVTLPSTLDALCERAIITYVMVHFGVSGDADYRYSQMLKSSYDEQKAQLQTATGYTNWGDTT
jgi:hypothetical protein